MSVIALITAPLVLLYHGWTYHVFRARVGGEELADGTAVAGGEAGSSSATS
jgi:hypothetical protein